MIKTNKKANVITFSSDKLGHVMLALGNEAIARGAIEAGVQVAAAYPGTPSSEILETLSKAAKDLGIYTQWSTNEIVAVEVATSASMAGLRAVTAMKAQGLNVALDFFLHLNLLGTNGGLVAIVCDDPQGWSSVNEQDSRWLVSRMGDFPLLEPASPQEAKDMAKWAFELSEEISSPVFLRSVTRISHGSGPITLGEINRLGRRARFDRSFSPNPVPKKHAELKQKQHKAKEFFEVSLFNWYVGPKSPKLTIVCSGAGWLYTLDALEILDMEDSVGIIKLGTTWPLPIEFISKHIQSNSSVLVIEEVDPFIEVHLKEGLYNRYSNGTPIVFGKNTGHVDNVGELNPDKVVSAIARILGINYRSRDSDYDKKAGEYAALITLPRPPIWCAGCSHRASLWVLKFVLRLEEMEGFATGDIGCYALDRYYGGWQLTRTQSCMGGGSGLASGFGKLQQFGFDQKVVANCGDSTFFHGAIPALINAVHYNSNATFMIMDNSATGMTGFQPHPGTLKDAMGDPAVPINIEKLCRSLGCVVEVADPFELEDAKNKLWNLIHQEGAKVMIMRRKCALLAAREEGPQYRVLVNYKKCVGEDCGCDRYCTRVFKCPGLIWDKTIGKAKVDEALCTGCGFCVNICPKSAIVGEKI